jgi:RNA polymerase sigma factor (sigma-70 family)
MRADRPSARSTPAPDRVLIVPVRADSDLVERCLRGERGAWDELVLRYSRYVYAVVSHGYHLRGPDAEDAFQEVFLRIYDRLGSLRDSAALRPWIAQLTRRVCLDRLAAAGREEPGEVEPAEVERTLEELDEAFAVREALGELSEECQEVLDRFFCRDESYRTIGEALGIPSGTIASRISRCLGKLRERFSA